MCDNSANKRDYIVVSTTMDDADKGDKLARMIVESRLAACVQQTPVKSTYRWAGELHVSDEVLLRAKTKSGLAQKLMEFIKAHHDYDLPELVVTPILCGDEGYLDWLADETE